MRRSIGVCLVALLASGLLGACSDGDDSGDEDAKPKSTAEVTKAPKTKYEGIIFAYDNFGESITELTFYDPEKKETTGRATVEGSSLYLRREQFASDLSGVVRATDCEVKYAPLENDRYSFNASWEPPPAYEEQNPCFTEAFFGVDDKLWAVSTPSSTGDGRLYEIDPKKPREEPKKVGEVSAINDDVGSPELDRFGKPGRESDLSGSGPTDEASTVILSDKVFLRAQVWVSTTNGDQVDSYLYGCDQPVDDSTLLCTSNPTMSGEGSPYGSVATVTANRDAGALELKQVAPASEGDTYGAWVSPNKKRVLISSESGYYLVDFDGKGAKGDPKLLFAKAPVQGSVMGWV